MNMKIKNGPFSATTVTVFHKAFCTSETGPYVGERHNCAATEQYDRHDEGRKATSRNKSGNHCTHDVEPDLYFDSPHNPVYPVKGNERS